MDKCSSLNHKEINSLLYCEECKIYMCNKCDKFHSELFQNHNTIKIEKGNENYFLDFVKKKIIKLNCNIFVRSIIYYVVQNALLN